MKRYVLRFLAVIAAAALTGGLLAVCQERQRQSSAAAAGYNLAVVNGLDTEVERLEISYELDGEQRLAESRGSFSPEEEICFLLDGRELTYRMALRLPGREAVEAELTDDFRRNAIVRYRIEEEDGEIVLRQKTG